MDERCKMCGADLDRVSHGLAMHHPGCDRFRPFITAQEAIIPPYEGPQESDEKPPVSPFEDTKEDTGPRDMKGRFLPGNPGSKGRPKGSKGFAKRVRGMMWEESGGFLNAEEKEKLDAYPTLGGSFLDKVLAVANDPTHTDFMKAVEYLTRRGYGKEADRVEVTGPNRGPVEVVGTLGDDSGRMAAILAILERADALPSGTGEAEPEPAPDAPDERLHETGADAPPSGVPPDGWP